MKKTAIIALLLTLTVALSACGGEKPAETAPAAPTAEPAVTAEPETAATAEPMPAEETEADPVAQVLSLKDHDVSELYELFGEPSESQYASSCLITGGQDGILYYDGFTVYTLVQPDGTETVYDAE